MEKKLTKDQYMIIDKIAERAMKYGYYDKKITCVLDITNAAKHWDMRLQEWLDADEYNFVHDLEGIANAICRNSYPVTFDNDPLFLPRFAN